MLMMRIKARKTLSRQVMSKMMLRHSKDHPLNSRRKPRDLPRCPKLQLKASQCLLIPRTSCQSRRQRQHQIGSPRLKETPLRRGKWSATVQGILSPTQSGPRAWLKRMRTKIWSGKLAWPNCISMIHPYREAKLPNILEIRLEKCLIRCLREPNRAGDPS